MTERTVRLSRKDLMRLLFAIGYTRGGVEHTEGVEHELIAPDEYARLGEELNQQWHTEEEGGTDG